MIERQDLVGQNLSVPRLHRQIAVQHVELFGAIFKEKAVADAFVNDPAGTSTNSSFTPSPKSRVLVISNPVRFA